MKTVLTTPLVINGQGNRISKTEYWEMCEAVDGLLKLFPNMRVEINNFVID